MTTAHRPRRVRNMAQSLRSARKPVVQARAVATRDKILRAAEAAFARYAFDGTSLTADIHEPARVSVGSFYHQFDNKTDLLLAVLRERMSSRRSRVVELLGVADQTDEASVRVALSALLDDVESSPDAWRVQYRERQHPDPAISRAVEAGWGGWAKTARSLVQRCFDPTSDRADAASRLTVVSGRRAAARVPHRRSRRAAGDPGAGDLGVGVLRRRRPVHRRCLTPAARCDCRSRPVDSMP